MRNHEDAYIHALNNMAGTKPGELARVADRMAGAAFDSWGSKHIKQPSQDAMMRIEASMFMALCDANGVDWRAIK